MPFINPVRVITPIRISSAAPTFTVYFTTFLFFLKKSSTEPVKIPTARKGMTKPSVYTPTNRNPFAEEEEEEAINSTLPSVGPTQGVQAKLKVKPSSSATSGFMENRSSRKGRRCSLSMVSDRPNTPSW